MFLQQITQWLSWLGGLVLGVIKLPASWTPFTQALPLWSFGLAAVIVALLIFKIVTHAVFKVLMWAALIVAVLILLSSLGLPLFQGWGGLPQ